MLLWVPFHVHDEKDQSVIFILYEPNTKHMKPANAFIPFFSLFFIPLSIELLLTE